MLWCVCWATYAMVACALNPNPTQLTAWRMENSVSTPGVTGQEVSLASFDDTTWTGVQVPTTVLAAMQAAGQLPDLDFGTNLQQVDASQFASPWWFRTCFSTVDFGLREGDQAVLTFHGINYRASLFAGGVEVANDTEFVGTFSYFRFDISSAVRNAGEQPVCVAVLVHRPHDVYWTRNATDLAIDFVDWSPDPSDGNMGLWRNVELALEHGVSLREPACMLQLEPFPDNPAGSVSNGGNITLSVLVEAPSAAPGSVDVQGSVQFQLESVGSFMSAPFSLMPGSSRIVAVSAVSDPRLSLSAAELGPVLWWPTGWGNATRLTLSATFVQASTRPAQTTDSLGRPVIGATLVTGSVSSLVGLVAKWSGLDAAGGRVFSVNGRPFPVRGGGYAPDLFQRMSADRHALELQHAVTVGLNTLRFEGKFQDDSLLDLMDAMGVMAMPGLCCCDAWQNWQLWGAEQHRVANRSVHDQLLRMRRHPSMLAFLLSSDQLPPAEVEAAYIAQTDTAGWQLPLIAAASAAVSPTLGPTGVKMNGPYAWVPPNYWLQAASLDAYGGAKGFSTEISPGAAPLTLESWKRTVPPAELWRNADGGFESDTWTAHCGNPHGLFGNLAWFASFLEARYGPMPAALDGESAARQFLLRGQAAAYESHRAMFESYRINEAAGAGGVVQWMANNAYPQHIWHLWDKYLNTGGSYAGTQAALRPYTPLLNASNASIYVAFDGSGDAPIVAAVMRVQLVTLDARTVFNTTVSLTGTSPILPRTVSPVPVHGWNVSMVRQAAADNGGVILVRLEIGRGSPTVVAAASEPSVASRVLQPLETRTPVSVYWFSDHADQIDWNDCNFYRCNLTSTERFLALSSGLSPVQTLLSNTVVFGEPENGQVPATVTLSLSQAATTVAFFVRLRLVDVAGDVDVVTYWGENYVTLMPGETRIVYASAVMSAAGSNGTAPLPVLVVEAWNDVIRPGP